MTSVELGDPGIDGAIGQDVTILRRRLSGTRSGWKGVGHRFYFRRWGYGDDIVG